MCSKSWGGTGEVLACQSSFADSRFARGWTSLEDREISKSGLVCLKKLLVKIPRQRILVVLSHNPHTLVSSPILFHGHVAFKQLLAHGHADHTPNGLHLGTQAKLAICWAGLYFTQEQKFWAMALILVPLKARLSFFHGGTDSDGTLEENPLNLASSIKLSKTSFSHGGLLIPQELQFH